MNNLYQLYTICLLLFVGHRAFEGNVTENTHFSPMFLAMQKVFLAHEYYPEGSGSSTTAIMMNTDGKVIETKRLVSK